MLESELIIFDCDGVLVDTEPLTNRVLARCVSAVGWEVDQAYSITHFKGRNLDDILIDVEAKLGKKLPGLMDEYRRQMYIEIHEFGVPALGGIHELLDALDAMGDQAPHRCIGTNAPLEKARLTLGGSGLIDRFEHRDGSDRQTMFSAYEVGKWKPDPGLFLHVAAAMGHEPEACIVVEDSTAGVIAAVAAGMRVIGLADLTPVDDLAKAGATQIVESHHELVAEFNLSQ
ncbi:haloacid dehalogenase [bacterium]|nr:MAG: haloacid dehalogenase [bacterium]